MGGDMAGQLGGFSFQAGLWRVRHRKLRERLAGCDEWLRFDGTCRAWDVLGGAGNVEDNVLNDPAGAYRAMAVRRIDPETGDWTIHWFDDRFSTLDPPVRGRFADGVGAFLAEDVFRGRPILVRFIWSRTKTSTPRWEQAFSDDAGANWETNWIMDFERVADAGGE